MKINCLIMDVDGTLTDGKIYMGSGGEILKAFSVKDGYGIHDLLPQYGIKPIIITGRRSEITFNRCSELGIYDIFQGVNDKCQVLESLDLDLNRVAYIGDDLNDYSCIKYVKSLGGIIGCPYNATKLIKEESDFVSSKNGGDGAVRDFIDWIIAQMED